VRYSTWSTPKYVLAALALVSAGISAYGAIKQGNEQSDAYASEAEARLAQAENEYYIKQKQIDAKKDEASVQAGRIHERARSIRSGQRAQSAGSGVVVDTGSAQHLVDQTNQLAERDALAVAYSANNFVDARQHEQYLINQGGINSANANAKKAEAAMIGGYTQAAGAVIQGGANVYAELG